MKSINRITIQNKVYVDIDTFMKENNLKTKKSVYDWVSKNKAETRKVINNAFFRKL